MCHSVCFYCGADADDVDREPTRDKTPSLITADNEWIHSLQSFQISESVSSCVTLKAIGRIVDL